MNLFEEVEGADAYLYDCDGTLALSMPIHIRAWIAELHAHGCTLSGETISNIITELAGMPGPEVVRVMNERYSLSLPCHELAEKKEERFFLHHIHEVKPYVDVVEHLKRHVGSTPVAVVSGGNKKIVEKTLEVIRVRQLVSVVICAEDVKKGKPSPEGFLLAASRLHVNPKKCVVFEDGALGIQAAHAAGMRSVKV